MQEISAIVLFCEDIRQEVGGQYSLIGVVGDNLNVLGVPGAIPKFAIYVRINFSIDAEPREFQIFLINPDGERILVSTIPKAMVESSILDAKEQGNRIVGIVSHMIAAPFPINSVGRYWIELVWGGGSLFLGSLKIGLGDDQPPKDNEHSSSLDPPPNPA